MTGGRRPLLLIYRALGLGDLLTAVPALRALADAFPDHRRVLATAGSLAPLARASGAVDDVVDAQPLAPLPRSVHGAEVGVNLHGRGPQSHAVLRATHPTRLIAFGDRSVWREGEHEVRRWCRMLTDHGIDADPTRIDLPVPTGGRAPGAARGATLIHPGAASGARRWPADRWATIARAERDAGQAVVVTGSQAERQLASTVAAAAGLPAGAVLAGSTTVADLAATVAAAALVVCGDTGVAHLATAMGTPSVVLFGPVPPTEWGPPRDRPKHVALWAGRHGDPHGDHPDPGLLAITVDDVLDGLARITPDRARPASRRHPAAAP